MNGSTTINELDPDNWVELFGDYLYSFALSRVKDKGIAEDLVQDALLAGIKNLSGFEGRSSIKSWLSSILNNKIIDHFNSSKKISRLEDDSGLESSAVFSSLGIWKVYVPNWARDPDSLLEAGQFREALQNCVSKLPERLAQVFAFKYIEERPADEICKVLNITESNYWIMLYRIRMALRRCLEKNWYNRLL